MAREGDFKLETNYEFYACLLDNYKDDHKLIVLEIIIYLLLNDKDGCACLLNEQRIV